MQELMTKTKRTSDNKSPNHDEQKKRHLSTLKEIEEINMKTSSDAVEVPIPLKEFCSEEKENDERLKHERFVALAEMTLKDLDDRPTNPSVEEEWEYGQPYTSDALIKSMADIKEKKSKQRLRLFSGLDEKQPEYDGTVCPQCKSPCDLEEMKDYNGKCSFCRQIDLRDPSVHQLKHFDNQWNNFSSEKYDYRSSNTFKPAFSSTNSPISSGGSMNSEQDAAKSKLQQSKQREEQQERLYPQQQQKEVSENKLQQKEVSELQRLQKQEELQRKKDQEKLKQQHEREELKGDSNKSDISDSFLTDGDIDDENDDTHEDINVQNKKKKPQNQELATKEEQKQHPSKAAAKSKKVTGITVRQPQQYEQQESREQLQMQEVPFRFSGFDHLTDGDTDEKDEDTGDMHEDGNPKYVNLVRNMMYRVNEIEENNQEKIDLIYFKIDRLPGWSVHSNLQDEFNALKQENKDLLRRLEALEKKNPTDSDSSHHKILPQSNNIIF
jgi:hypothetical protein